MSEQNPAWDAFAADWIAAWNAHDLDRILAHYSEDIHLVSPVAAERLGVSDGEVCGKQALRDYFATGLAPGSTLRFELHRCYAGVNSVVLEYGRHDGRRGAEMMEFDDHGRVRRVVAHYTREG